MREGGQAFPDPHAPGQTLPTFHPPNDDLGPGSERPGHS